MAAGLSNGTAAILCFQAPKGPEKPRSTVIEKRPLPTAPEQESYVVMKEKYTPLLKFDKCLKSFRYREALDVVVRRCNANLLVCALGELIRRDGLRTALSGRTEADLSPLVRMITKFICSPRHASHLIEAAYALLDIYSSVVGQSESFDNALKELRLALSHQIEIQRMFMQLEGSMAVLVSNNELSFASTDTDRNQT